MDKQKSEYTFVFQGKKDHMNDAELAEIIIKVKTALENNGYDPVQQLMGYIISGDPTYITNSNSARELIFMIPKDAILAHILKCYFKMEKTNKTLQEEDGVL